MIDVGIIGAGFIGKTHAAGYKRVEDVRIAGIADANEEAGQTLADDCGAEYYSSAEELISQSSIQVIDICVPTPLHEKFTVLAADYGKNVICEKPITLTMESFNRMKSAVDKAGVKFMTAQVLRFWPEYTELKKLHDSGELGEIMMVYASRLAQHPNWSSWFRDAKKSGGGLFDLHLHDIDYVCHLFGEVNKVYSIGKRSEIGAWNFIVSTLIFKNGVRAAVECSYEMTENYPFSMNLRSTGKEGTAEFIFKAGFNLENRNDVISSLVLYKNGKDPVEIPASQADAYAQEVAYFIECVRNGYDPEVITMDDSRHTLAVILSIKESLETEEVVSV